MSVGRTMLALMQEFCARNALATIADISSNATAKQLAGLIRELVEDLPQDARLTFGLRQASFAGVASEDQGDLKTLTSDTGFEYIINDTLWDANVRLPLLLTSPEEWAAIQTLGLSGPRRYYRLMQGHLHVYPAPASVSECTFTFDYVTSWLFTNNAGTPKATFDTATDKCVLPDNLILAGLKWRWRSTKGLPYEDAERSYYQALNNYLAKDGTKRAVNVSQPPVRSAEPCIVIPAGDWLQ